MTTEILGSYALQRFVLYNQSICQLFLVNFLTFTDHFYQDQFTQDFKDQQISFLLFSFKISFKTVIVKVLK